MSLCVPLTLFVVIKSSLSFNILFILQVIGDDVENTAGTILSVSQITGLVTVKLDPEDKSHYSPRYSDTVKVPTTRVQPSRNKVRCLLSRLQSQVSMKTVSTESNFICPFLG